MAGKTKNITASVHQRLLNKAKESSRPFNEILHKDTVTATRITEDADYKGVRVFLRGNLSSIRLFLQIDIGFGDVIIPKPDRVNYPVLLDFPPPELDGYSMESTVAEKFQAMVKLGLLNSRMKDFYDIWFLSRRFDFKGETLIEAIEKTFEKRKTPLISEPSIFNPTFIKDDTKQAQWKGFIDKAKLTNAPSSFEDVAAAVKVFLQPIVDSTISKRMFQSSWIPPGPWRR